MSHANHKEHILTKCFCRENSEEVQGPWKTFQSCRLHRALILECGTQREVSVERIKYAQCGQALVSDGAADIDHPI